MDSTVANRIDEAKQAGIAIVACQNTMRSMKLTEADMLPNTSYVPSGVVETRQEAKGRLRLRSPVTERADAPAIIVHHFIREGSLIVSPPTMNTPLP